PRPPARRDDGKSLARYPTRCSQIIRTRTLLAPVLQLLQCPYRGAGSQLEWSGGPNINRAAPVRQPNWGKELERGALANRYSGRHRIRAPPPGGTNTRPRRGCAAFGVHGSNMSDLLLLTMSFALAFCAVVLFLLLQRSLDSASAGRIRSGWHTVQEWIS